MARLIAADWGRLRASWQPPTMHKEMRLSQQALQCEQLLRRKITHLPRNEPAENHNDGSLCRWWHLINAVSASGARISLFCLAHASAHTNKTTPTHQVAGSAAIWDLSDDIATTHSPQATKAAAKKSPDSSGAVFCCGLVAPELPARAGGGQGVKPLASPWTCRSCA